MNKKRISILVATLVVLAMAFALLAGCGLDVNFKKKVEKKGWSYSEYGRESAKEEASSLLYRKFQDAKVEKAIKKVKATAYIEKAEKEDGKRYAIQYIEFDDSASANTYYAALKKTAKEAQEESKYKTQKEIKEIDNKIALATSYDALKELNEQREKLVKELNNKDNETVIKKSGKIVSFGTKKSFSEFNKK